LVTTDVNGVRTFVDRQSKDESFLYKELLISGFGIYLQNEDEYNCIHQYTRQQQAHTFGGGRGNLEYILSPLSFQAKLRQSDLDTCIDFPKYQVHSKLSSLSISLSRTQLELGHRLALAVKPQYGTIRPLFPEYRPLIPIRADAKSWWFYAVRCIGRLNRRRSWMEFYSAFKKRKVYVELYKRCAHAENAAWLTPLTDGELCELQEIENDRSISIEGLMHWRNLADGQVEREREKMLAKRSEQSLGASTSSSGSNTTPGKSRYRLFGTPKKELRRDSTADTEFYECLDDENAAPITLSADEMKELEELAMKKADETLTKDSMFCDVNFTLGSFQVNLTTVGNQPITSLEMDMVSTSFKAKADGSFAFGLSLLSLEVLDSVTAGTFYPTICRSLQKSQTKQSHAFQLQLKKSKGGDQELVLKMVACEIVASPLLMFAVVEFFKLPMPTSKNANPILLETVSGEEDTFFDARERESTIMTSSPVRASTVAAPIDSPMHHNVEPSKDGKVSDKISSAIVDAWNGKNQKKQHWTMDFDISAPILILPEDCVNAGASCLICNFGKFNFAYGSVALSHSVVEWFEARQRSNKMDSEIDHLKLEMNDLSFTISSVGDASKKGLEGLNRDVSTSVISPVSFTLDIGLEHTISSSDSTPRTCVIGVLPAIILRLAPSHVTKVLRVAGIWSSNLHKLRGDTQITNESSLGDVQEESDLEIMSSDSGISLLDAECSNNNSDKKSLLSKKDRLESILLEKKRGDSSVASEFMHVSLSLLRLSL
jgi:vacuolar protein sorting-associated protein 13A/C